MGSLRKLSPLSYILALLCFLLPFVQISCAGQKLVTLTGVQLMTGTEIKPPTELFGIKADPSATAKMTVKTQKTDPNWFAAIAFIAGVVGVIFSVLKANRSGLLAGIAGAAGAICLLIMRVNISSEMSKKPVGDDASTALMAAFTVEYQTGYYVCLLLFIFGAVALLMSEFRPAAAAETTLGGNQLSISSSAPTPEAAPPSGVCAKCGAPLRGGSRFCAACGTWARSAAN